MVVNNNGNVTFRAALGLDDATWARARGHALSQAAIFIPYYVNSNPVGVANSWRQLNAVLEEAPLLMVAVAMVFGSPAGSAIWVQSGVEAQALVLRHKA